MERHNPAVDYWWRRKKEKEKQLARQRAERGLDSGFQKLSLTVVFYLSNETVHELERHTVAWHKEAADMLERGFNELGKPTLGDSRFASFTANRYKPKTLQEMI